MNQGQVIDVLQASVQFQRDIIEVLLAGLVFQAFVIFLVLRIVTRLRGRYEQFRMETGEAFMACADRDNDLDIRLTAAGYPPTRGGSGMLPQGYQR
jgi:hypothetical protein